MSIKIDYDGLPCTECGKPLSYFQAEEAGEKSEFRCKNGHACDTAPEPVAVGVSRVPGPTEADVQKRMDDAMAEVHRALDRAEETSGQVDIVEDEASPLVDSEAQAGPELAWQGTEEVLPLGPKPLSESEPRVVEESAIAHAERTLAHDGTCPDGGPFTLSNGDVSVRLRIPDRHVSGLKAMAEMLNKPFQQWLQEEFERILDNEWFGR